MSTPALTPPEGRHPVWLRVERACRVGNLRELHLLVGSAPAESNTRRLIDHLRHTDHTITTTTDKMAAVADTIRTLDVPLGHDDSLLVKQLWRPIFTAVRFGHIKVAKYLLGAAIGFSSLSQPYATSQNGNEKLSLLHIASTGSSVGIVQYLIRRGVDINGHTPGQGVTPLHLCCFSGTVEVMQCLLDDSFIDVMATDANGRTCLHYAALGGQHLQVKVLVERFPQLLAATDKGGSDALLLSAWAPQNAVEVAKVLVAASKKTNMPRVASKDRRGNTIADYAAASDPNNQPSPIAKWIQANPRQLRLTAKQARAQKVARP